MMTLKHPKLRLMTALSSPLFFFLGGDAQLQPGLWCGMAARLDACSWRNGGQIMVNERLISGQ